MLQKLRHSLTEDIAPMLPADVTYGDTEALAAFEKVWSELIVLLKGNAWKRSDAVIEELRKSLGAGFLQAATE